MCDLPQSWNYDVWFVINLHFNSLERNEQFVSITPDIHRKLSCGSWQCGQFYPTTDSSSGTWIRVAPDSSSGGWIRVAANSILLLTSVSAAGYKLHLIPSHSWFEFQRLDRSCGRFHCTADLSSSGWMWVVTDSILRLFWVLATWYELWLTLSCGWLESGWLDTSYSWFHPAANCELRLILSNGWLKICQLNSTRGLLILWYMQQI